MKQASPFLLKDISYLLNDHLLCSSASLASLHYSLEEEQILDVATLLNAVDEVLDLRLCDFATQVSIITEYFSESFSFYHLQVCGGVRCQLSYSDKPIKL